MSADARVALLNYFGDRVFTEGDARAVQSAHGARPPLPMRELHALGIVEPSGTSGRRWRLSHPEADT